MVYTVRLALSSILLLGGFLQPWCTSCLSGGEETPPAALDVARRNKAAIELIQTFHCTYTKQRLDNTGKVIRQFPETEYWRSGTSFRARWHKGSMWCDTVVTDLVLKTASEQTKTGVLARYVGFPLSEGDPWLDPQIQFVTGKKEKPLPIYFSEMIAHPDAKVSVRSEMDGQSTIDVVEIAPRKGGARGTYCFNRSKNGMLSKSVASIDGLSSKLPSHSVTITIDRFTEPAPGIFVPADVTIDESINGKLTHRDICRIQTVQVNTPLPAGIFTLDFKPKDRVHDLVEGVQYILGADGKSRTSVREVPQAPPTRGEHGEVVEQLTETKSEPRLFPRWPFLASLTLITLGGIAWIVNRQRARKSHVTQSESKEDK